MHKLDRSGTATRLSIITEYLFLPHIGPWLLVDKRSFNFCISFAGTTIGAPVLNGSVSIQQPIGMPINGAAIPTFPAQIVTPMVQEPIGIPSECLLLKNMFDPATEVL